MDFVSNRQISALAGLFLIYSLIGFFIIYQAYSVGGYEAGIFYATIFTCGLVPAGALTTIFSSLPNFGNTKAAGEPKKSRERPNCGCACFGYKGKDFTADRSIFIIGQPVGDQSIRIGNDGVQVGDLTPREILNASEDVREKHLPS